MLTRAGTRVWTSKHAALASTLYCSLPYRLNTACILVRWPSLRRAAP